MPINGKRYGDGFGYNERQFKALVVLSKDMNITRAVAQMLRLKDETARNSIRNGNFTRNEIALMANECGWTPEQVAGAFFDIYRDEKEAEE